MTPSSVPYDLDVGYDVPAAIGMAESRIQTPCLILELDALERNIRKLGKLAREMGIAHRAHAKAHKSVDVARLQMELGGARGICCQKVSEAEVFARGGIQDILVTNQVRDPAKIDRLARLPKLGARAFCCVDDADNVADLAMAARRHGTVIECLVEIDCGSGRCGVTSTREALAIAERIDRADGVAFTGIQAYYGVIQHVERYEDRKAGFDRAAVIIADAVQGLEAAGFHCGVVSGGGTGSFEFEGRSGIYNEIQCGSYAFMDASYGRVRDKDGNGLGEGEWEHALFILSSIMSCAKPGTAVCDAGLKVHSADSGLPVVFEHSGLDYVKSSDEHGIILDPQNVLNINDRLRLIPGHCDPTCNLHDWYVGVRKGMVETLWPVSARGKAY